MDEVKHICKTCVHCKHDELWGECKCLKKQRRCVFSERVAGKCPDWEEKKEHNNEST